MFASVKKKFWSNVETTKVDAGYAVALDGRLLKTPAKSDLIVPSHELAQAIQSEWDAIETDIDPDVLPFTRLANASIDKVVPQGPEIVAMLAAYGETDLLCHRADGPDGLVARQADTWDPVLTWALNTHGLRFDCVAGIMAVDQPKESLDAISDWLAAQNPFALMALHDLTTISGSVILARAIDGGFLDGDAAWAASRVDEDWQAELWGLDSIAVKAAKVKEAEFLRASVMLDMVRDK